MDHAQPSIRFPSRPRCKVLYNRARGRKAKIPTRFDASEHVVLRKDFTEWQLSRRNIISRIGRKNIQIQSHETEFHDSLAGIHSEHDHPAIGRIDFDMTQHAEGDRLAVVSIQRGRHVAIVNEKTANV